jgi:hypothetical protein
MTKRPWKTLSLIMFAFLLLSLSACGGSGDAEDGSKKPSGKALSFEEAAQVVLDEVVKPDDLDHEVIVFGWPEILTAEDELQSYAADDLTLPGETILVNQDSWFFWVDDAPVAYYVHPTRFVLVDVQTGEVSSHDEEWWPVLNGISLWVDTPEYWDEANWIFSNLETQSSSQNQLIGSYKLALPAPVPLIQQEGGPNFGLVVNGWSAGQAAEEPMEHSREDMDKVLDKSGFGVETVKPGDPNVKNKIRDWIRDRAAEMQPSQTAMIYLTGHGTDINGVGVISVGGEYLTESELTEWLKDFHPGVHIIIVLDTCHAGAWKDGLMEVADVNVTSTGADQWAGGDYDPPGDPNPADRGGEYSSGYYEDWDEIIGSDTERAKAHARAEENGTNYWEEVAMMSHDSALKKDYFAIRGYTSPDAVRGNPFTTRWIPISPFTNYVNAGPTLTMNIMDNMHQDGTEDGHVSSKNWDINVDVNSVGINWTTAFIMAFSQAARDEWHNDSYFECGTQVGDVLTFCAPDAGLMPEGDVLFGLIVLDSDIPLDPGDDIYQYGFVLDSDNDHANNFQFVPPYTLDYFQGTDLWYEVYYYDGWQLEAISVGVGPIPSNARAAIIKNILVYFIPMNEISAEYPSYRFSAFGCVDGDWGSGFCNGDVSGIDATYPPIPVPQEKVVIEE